MSLFGLLNTEDFSAQRFTSIRRSVFYQYPNGAAPLLGILSMLDGEVLNDPVFSWYEDRLKEKATTTVVNGTTSGAWYADSSGSLGSAMATTAADRTKDTAYWLRVASLEPFRGNDIILFRSMNVTGTTVDAQFRILPNASGVWSNTSSTVYHIRVTPIVTVANVLNVYNQSDAGLSIVVLSNANMEGQSGAFEGHYALPVSVGNYSQIFRTPISFTNTAIKVPAKFDESGPYKDKAKKARLNHMIELELQFLFGDPSKSVDTTTGLPTYTTGGIMFFLKLWEVGNGNSVAGVTSTYGNTAATLITDDNKRILNVAGNITDSNMDDYMERLFRFTNNISSEKLGLCGSGFLNIMNKLFKKNVQMTASPPVSDTYGMNMVKMVTPFGTVYLKTHPLFNRSASLRNNALFIDAQNLRYRYMQDRDTNCKKNLQNPKDDFRLDEWFTDAGLELQFPESMVYMTGITGAA